MRFNVGAWMRRYMGEKAAKLRANGNVAAAEALVRKYDLRDKDIPTLDAKGKRRGKTDRLPATEDAPPPKMEPVNKQFVRRADL